MINDIKTVDQIRNISQEKKNNPEIEAEAKVIDKNLINSFDDLLEYLFSKKRN